MSKKIALFFTIILSVALFFHSCNTKPAHVLLDVAAKPFEKLSDYNFFSGVLNELKPNKRVLPYDLITPLFTDYAFKARFVYVPEGKSAAYDTTQVLQLPVGSCLIKNFYYPEDFNKPEGKRRIMETRLLVHREKGWDNLDYVWNEDQTEALLDLTGGIKKVSWIHYDGQKREIDYLIPNKNQCKSCHWRNDASFSPIGPKVRNLNRNYAYADGTENQLARWATEGILTGLPSTGVPAIADWTDSVHCSVNERARAYLEMNCGHCHNPKGPAYTSGLLVDWQTQSVENLGVCKAPVAAGKATGGRLVDIEPRNPDASILIYRVENDDPGIRMPEIGRSVLHKEGVELLRRWINEMNYPACGTK